MKYSERQRAIFDTYENTHKNIVIEAGPGSGKTFCLVECCKRTPSYKRVLFMAFNKSIAEELKEKLPQRCTVGTFHSMGLKVLFQNFSFKMKLNENKIFKIALKHLDFDQDDKIPQKQKLRYLMELQEIYNQIRINLLVDYKKDIPNICIDKDFEFRERMIEDIIVIEREYLKQAQHIHNSKEFEIDFTDMLYLPYILLDESGFPKYDVVMVDECQDQNCLQRELILRFVKKGGRFIYVGDKKQCQPAGTKILMADRTYKNIEDVQVGEGVACFHRKSAGILGLSAFEGGRRAKGFEILDKQSRMVDEIISVRLKNGMISSYSKEHICYAKFNRERVERCYILYLMCNALGMWRIGITKLYNEKSGSSFGLSFRMRLENCIKGWILNIYDSRVEAMKAESIYSYKFGIPQLTFCIERSSNKSILKDKDIVDIYNQIGSLNDRVIEILKYFNKDINCPFVVNKDNIHKSRDHIFLINACNLFTEYMEMAYIDYDKWYCPCKKNGSRRYLLNYSPIEKIEIKKEKQMVYCLDVKTHHNYIADGILTHNCIYSFTGSSISNFECIQRTNETVTLPLDITYRCAKKIVDEANKVFPGLIACESNEEGEVCEGSYTDAKEGDFILCRNNLPLVEAFIKLLSLNKKATIKGKDFGDSLNSILSKISRISDLNTLLENKLKELMNKGLTKSAAMNNLSYVNLAEKVSIIIKLYRTWSDFETMKQAIEIMFSEDTKDGIILSTIHKSKGLEADTVYFLQPELIPSPHITTEEMLYSEKCLKFVAITRAKKRLVYCH